MFEEKKKMKKKIVRKNIFGNIASNKKYLSIPCTISYMENIADHFKT